MYEEGTCSAKSRVVAIIAVKKFVLYHGWMLEKQKKKEIGVGVVYRFLNAPFGQRLKCFHCSDVLKRAVIDTPRLYFQIRC